MDVTIAVCTYGECDWRELAQTRAIPSAEAQEGVERVLHVHSSSLQDARNEALRQVDTEYIIYLDADDELESGYVAAMQMECENSYYPDMMVPRVRYVGGPWGDREPYFPQVYGHMHDCQPECLREGNWMVIGTCVPTHLLRILGGWNDYEWSEDWDMWLRCWKRGATIERSYGSIYRAHVNMNSRNRGCTQEFRNNVHRQIYEANFGN